MQTSYQTKADLNSLDFQLNGGAENVESRKCRRQNLSLAAQSDWLAQKALFQRISRSKMLNLDVLVWIDSKPFHAGNQGGAADAHTYRSSVGASNAPFALGQYADDLVMLFLCVLIFRTLAF